MPSSELKPASFSYFAWPLTSVGAFVLPFLLIGCSEQPTQKLSAQVGQPIQADKSSSQPKVSMIKPTTAEQNAIAQPATGFLTAIIQGRQQEAKQWLTPTAKKQVEENKSLLNPLGFQVEKLELGRVVTISSDDAAVEFLIVEAGGANSEEVCCLMKRNQSGWGVAGIACEAGPGEAPSVISFEHGRRGSSRRKLSEPKPTMDQFVDGSAITEEFRTANESVPTVR